MSEASSNFAASAALFETELDHVYRTLRRLGAQPVEAQDLTQDVFVVACRRWSDYQPDRPLRPWLAGIAHRVARDYFRRYRRRELATEQIEQEDVAPGPEDQLSSSRARRLALQALAQLPEHHRAILVRHELEGLNIREIAEETSVPFFTAAARLRRARLRFAAAVKQLQARRDQRFAILSVEAILEAERLVPALPGPLRASLLAGLAQGAAGGSPLVPAIAASARAARSLPLAPASVPVGVALVSLVALLFWPRAEERIGDPQAGELAHAAGESAASERRPVAPPQLVPRVLSTAAGGDEPRPPAGLARGLVAHWRLDDAPGSERALDASGRGHACILRDLDPQVAWVKGRVGGAIDLGRTGWLECPLPEARADVPFDLTAAAWIKRARRRPYSALFTRQLPTGKNAHLFWFGLRDDLLTVWSGSWSRWTSTTLEPPEKAAGWTHVAFVHAGSNTRLFVDGVLVRHTGGQLPRGEGIAQGALTIGSARFRFDPERAPHHFDGLIDEAIVYDRALGDAEVAALAKR